MVCCLMDKERHFALQRNPESEDTQSLKGKEKKKSCLHELEPYPVVCWLMGNYTFQTGCLPGCDKIGGCGQSVIDSFGTRRVLGICAGEWCNGRSPRTPFMFDSQPICSRQTKTCIICMRKACMEAGGSSRLQLRDPI